VTIVADKRLDLDALKDVSASDMPEHWDSLLLECLRLRKLADTQAWHLGILRDARRPVMRGREYENGPIHHANDECRDHA
jgi:hypothetical protein